MKVDRYVEPAEFDDWKRIAEHLGFLYVASGPLVRSSYKVSHNGYLSIRYADSSSGWRILH
jgi:lipoate synthase